MTWSYKIHRTRDGAPLYEVAPVDHGSWSRRLSYKGKGSHQFLVTENPGVEEIPRLPAASRTLVIYWDDEAQYAGVIWGARYVRADGTLTLTHEDVWSIWERRMVTGQQILEDSPDSVITKTYTTFIDLSLQTIGKRAVQWGMHGPVSDRDDEYALPVELPDDVAGVFQRRYWSYDFLSVSEVLSGLSEYPDGFYYDFRPVVDSSGWLFWRFRGFQINSRNLDLPVSAPDSPVVGLTWEADMSRGASELHITGEGSGRTTMHSRLVEPESSDLDDVPLAVYESRSSIKDEDELDSLAQGIHEERNTPAEQIECTVLIGGEAGVDPNELIIGMTVRVLVSDDPVMVDSPYERMLIGYRPSGPNQIVLELAEEGGS